MTYIFEGLSMSRNAALLITLTLLGITPAHAISTKYAEQLERSGCTQVTEAQGCDIHKTKAENAKAGFGAAAPAAEGGLNLSYEQKLERSGCTQVSELNGCDINKTKAENAAAGVGNAPAAATSGSPYAGNWIATFPKLAPPWPTSASMARIRCGSTTRRSMPRNPMARWYSRMAWSSTPFRGSPHQG